MRRIALQSTLSSRPLGLALSLAFWLLAQPGLAAEAPAGREGKTDARPAEAQEEAALNHGRNGKRLLDGKQFAEAEAEFRQSYAALEVGCTAYFLALALEGQVKLLEAKTYFTKAAVYTPESTDRNASKHNWCRNQAIEHAPLLDAQIPRLTLVHQGKPAPELKVTLDGRTLTLGEIGRPILLDPGEHELVIQHGMEKRKQKLTLSVGVAETVQLNPTSTRVEANRSPESKPGPTLPLCSKDEVLREGQCAPARNPGSPLKQPLFWGGIGVAALGLGAGALALATKPDGARCEGISCLPGTEGDNSMALTWATLSTVGVLTGGLAIGVSLFLPGDEEAPSTGLRLDLGPAWAGLRGSF